MPVVFFAALLVLAVLGLLAGFPPAIPLIAIGLAGIPLLVLASAAFLRQFTGGRGLATTAREAAYDLREEPRER